MYYRKSNQGGGFLCLDYGNLVFYIDICIFQHILKQENIIIADKIIGIITEKENDSFI